MREGKRGQEVKPSHYLPWLVVIVGIVSMGRIFTQLALRTDSVCKLRCPSVVYMPVCLSVPSQKPHFPVDWRILVIEHIANIGIKYIGFLGPCKPAYCA